MWAQLIKMQLKPGSDTSELVKQIRSAEQPGSGLVRTLWMHHQTDPDCLFTLVVFENEEKARAREQDPRRHEALQQAHSLMAAIVEGPPEFTDLVVGGEWTDATA